MKSLTITLLIFLPVIASQSSDNCLSQLCSQSILPTPPECQKPTFEEWSACICPHPMWAGVISQCIQECEPQDRGWVQTCPGGSVPRPLVSSNMAPTLPPLPTSPASTALPLQPIPISFVLSSSSKTSTVSIGTFHPLETPTTSQLSTTTDFEPIIADRTVSKRTSVYTLPTLIPTSSPSPGPTSTNSASSTQLGGCVGIGLRFFGPTVAVTGCLAFLAGV